MPLDTDSSMSSLQTPAPYKSKFASNRDNFLEKESQLNHIQDEINHLKQSAKAIVNKIEGLENILHNDQININSSFKDFNQSPSIETIYMKKHREGGHHLEFNTKKDKTEFDTQETEDYYPASMTLTLSNNHSNDMVDVESNFKSENRNILGKVRKIKSEKILAQTSGIHLYSILATTRSGYKLMNAWLAASISLVVITLQIISLVMVFGDFFMLKLKKDKDPHESESSGGRCDEFVLSPQYSFILLFVSILFVCSIIEDIEEAMTEEALLENVVRSNQLVHRIPFEIVANCVSIRKFLLPTLLPGAAIVTLFFEENINASSIVLNFLAVAFIGEADDILAKLIYKHKRHVADALISEVTGNDEIEVENFWSNTLGIAPTLIVMATSIIYLSAVQCNKLFVVLFQYFTSGMLSSMLFVAYNIIQFIGDVHSESIFKRVIHLTIHMSLDTSAWCWFYVVTNLLFGLHTSALMGISGFFALSLTRIYYHFIDLRKLTGRDFSLFILSLVSIAYGFWIIIRGAMLIHNAMPTENV